MAKPRRGRDKPTGMSDKAYDTMIGRSHLTGYEAWPPPRHIHEHLDVFASFIEDLAAGGTILDLGCGDGSIARLIAERSPKTKIVGVDLEAHDQWKYRRPANLQFRTASIYDLPFKPGSFDTVIMKDVLHHLPDPDKVLLGVAKLAKKNVLIVEANRYNPISYVRMVKIARHEHFSRRKLKKITGRPLRHVTVETHVWPGKFRWPGRVNDYVFNKTPPLSYLRNYNLVLISPKR